MRFLISMFLVFVVRYAYSQQTITEQKKLRKSVYFGGGSYYITDDQIIGIQLFMEKFENLENYEITVAGHTDDIGGREYNEWLSSMRSIAVKQQLIQMRIPDEMIHIKKFGQDNPLYDNQSWMGKQGNRRVDIILTPIVF